MTPDTYRATDFMEATTALQDAGVSVVVGTPVVLALSDEQPGDYVVVPFHDPAGAIAAAKDLDVDGVLALDDDGTVAAAAIAEAHGLAHNPLKAARTTRNKVEMRRVLTDAGLRQPWFTTDMSSVVDYPCVVKPVGLSASRGVLRVDDEPGLRRAVARLDLLLTDGPTSERNAAAGGEVAMLIEGYLDGAEYAVEGLVTDGELEVLALFDKPDPLTGPVFEETLYITPSRASADRQRAIAACVADGIRAVGLRRGPVHAEVRVDADGPWLVEIASRTIGGLCSRTLRFGTGMSLEELILRHAAGLEIPTVEREGKAAGVMMVPIPKPGVLKEVGGVEEATAVKWIEGFTQTIPIGADVVPLPEGRRYLGFIFARGEDPAEVEVALRQAHASLRFVIE